MPGPCACPSDSGAASPDREAGESLRLLGEGFDPLDGGMRWAAAGPRDHPVHRILLALEDGLDGAVWPVPHPTGNALLPSAPRTRVPINTPPDPRGRRPPACVSQSASYWMHQFPIPPLRWSDGDRSLTPAAAS